LNVEVGAERGRLRGRLRVGKFAAVKGDFGLARKE